MRREFLAGAAAATVSVVRPGIALGSRVNSTIRLGLIGCGGRGTWIANLFAATGQYRFVACADYFPDRAEAFGNGSRSSRAAGSRRSRATSGCSTRRRRGGDREPALLPSRAGRGRGRGRQACLPRQADGRGRARLPDHRRGGQEGHGREARLPDRLPDPPTTSTSRPAPGHSGAIGRLQSGVACYPWSASVHDDRAATTPEERLRSWYQTRALCGDVIVEQDIHAIDVATWFAGADPIKAVGTGSRSTRKYGDVWGHFAVLYTFPDNFQVSFTSQKAAPAPGRDPLPRLRLGRRRRYGLHGRGPDPRQASL